VPDVIVIPAEWIRSFANDPDTFHADDEPLPLVVESWSKTTGDDETTPPIYRQRGDLELCYLHPYRRALTVWRRQPDCGYAESVYTSGIVPVVCLPGVSIDFDAFLEG
jgi:hypothetical protein